MPAVSQAQRAYLFAKFGKKWAHRHGMDNEGPLPAHAHGKKKRGAHGLEVAAQMKKRP